MEINLVAKIELFDYKANIFKSYNDYKGNMCHMLQQTIVFTDAIIQKD